MRSLNFDRRRTLNGKNALVGLLACLLLLTGIPLASAVDDVAQTEPPAATDTAVETTEAPAPAEDPIVVIPDEKDEPAQAPVEDPVEAPADTEPVEPAPKAPPADDTSDQTQTNAPAEQDAAPAKSDAEPTVELAPAVAGAAPDGGDFSIDWAASQPASYSHVTGGGVYASGSNATTVESLNSGDFACGDIVSYLAAITVDDSNATDASTLQFTTSFATLTSSQSGIGHEDIIRAVINTGDPGMDGDASLVSLVESTSGGDLVGVITVDDLEAGEQIIVRVDVRLGCQTGGKNTGTIHASLGDIRVIAPTNEVVPGGAQTIPFKQDGVRRPLTVSKVVVGTQPASTSYTVTVTCLKGDTATLTFTGSGSQVAGQIPEGDTCTVTETADGGADRTTVKVNNGTATAGHSTNITIGASNEVTFTNTFLAPVIDVEKSASPTTVTPGGTITYTISATNTVASPIDARNVFVTDDLDDDLADVAATFAGGSKGPGTCTVGAGNTISCDAGTVVVGSAVVVTVTARATLASCGNVLNTARATGSNFARVSSGEVTVVVQCAPDISVVKSSSTANAVPGEPFTFTITATNAATATAAARGVVISDTLDNSLSGATATYKVGTGANHACNPVGTDNIVRCEVGTLGIGESATATIIVTPTVASCPSITNRGVVSGTNFGTEQSDPVVVGVTCTPALTIAKAASRATVASGESYEYTITVRSPASATATSRNVVVTDTLHIGLLLQRPTFKVDGGVATECAPVLSDNSISCSVGDLAPGSEAVITIPVTATPASCGPIVNTARVAADNVTEKRSNEVTVNVTCTPALTLGKTASAATVAAGDDITYTITANNPATASAAAADVFITDDLHDDFTLVSAKITKAGVTTDCLRGPANDVSCNAGDIAINQSVVVTIVATTTEAACGLVTNTSEAAGTNFTTFPSNTVSVTVVCPPVIVPTKAASTGTVAPGDAYTYTITTTNNAGPTGSAAQDVVITDDLDDDLSGVTATFRVGAGPETGCDPTATGNKIRCAVNALPIGATATVTIAATATVEACGVVRNVSTASGTNFTSVTSNEVNVLIPCPTLPSAITLVKTGVAPTRGVGDLITYTYLVTNTGQTTLTDVTLVDDVLGPITLAKTTLTAGESTTATATHAITLADVERTEVVNVAVVTGKTPSGGTVTATDTETIPIQGAPSIDVEKTPNVDFAAVGETVTYSYVITNTGTTRLTDITLVDDKIGTIVSVDDAMTLQPGESRTVTADYTLTEADLAAGDEVVNVADVSGLPPSGPPVTDRDRAKVGITQVLATGQLRIVKALDGDGEPVDGSVFAFEVDCGDFALGRESTFTLPEIGGERTVGIRIPTDQVCTVTETRTAGADQTTIAVGTAAPVIGTSADVTIRRGVTTVTVVNTYTTRPVVPPEPPNPPDLPATGADLMVQLMLGLVALALGTSLVRRFRPATGGPSRRRGGPPGGWSTSL